MARGTLSFFSRLFSSKKKKILEKRNQEANLGNENSDESLSTNHQPQNVAAVDDAGSHTEEDSYTQNTNIATAIDESEMYAAQGEADTSHESYGSQENLAQDYSQDTSTATASAAAVAQDNAGNFSISTENVETEEGSLQEYANDTEQDTGEGTGQDDALEYDSMVLLSKLEQLMIRLSDKSVQKSAPLVIEALVEMTNYAVEFSEQLPISDSKKISLQTLLNRDEQNYKILKPEFIQNERLVVESEAVTEYFQQQEAFTDISNDILRVINVYLSASVKAFQSSRISEQWKTLYTGFFVNLTKSVRSSQANQ